MLVVTNDIYTSFEAYVNNLPCRLQRAPSNNGFIFGDCGKFLMYGDDELYTKVFVSFKLKDVEVVVLSSERISDHSIYVLIQNTARIAAWLDHCNQAMTCIDESLARNLCDEVFPDLLKSLSACMTSHYITPPVFDIRDIYDRTPTPCITMCSPINESDSGFRIHVYNNGSLISSLGKIHMKGSCPNDVLHNFLIALMSHNECLVKVQ